MRVSLNELETRYARAIEAVGVAPGLAQDAARIVVWHDIWRLDGLAMLAGCLDRLGTTPPARQAQRASAEAAVLDACGGSLLTAGPQALDLLEVEAGRRPGGAVVEIVDCADSSFAAGVAALAGERGLDVTLSAASSGNGLTATATAGGDVTIVRPSTARDRVPLPGTVVCRTGAADTASAQALTGAAVLEPAELATRIRAAVEDGVFVDADAWARIYRLGARLLVLDTEGSRQRGAGGGSDND